MWKLFAVLVLSAIAVSAQPTPMSPELRAFVMRPDVKKAVISAMTQQWRALTPECAEPQIKQMNVLIIEAPVFDSDGNPTRGAWKMVGQLEGCGQTKVMNLRYGFGKDGKLTLGMMLPGTTHADPLLQRDALLHARMAMVSLAPKDCKESAVIDTRFLKYGEAIPNARPGFETRSWLEEWTVKACGVVGTVGIRFIPDATGTTISAEMAKAQQ
jgi:hypothetical protein